MTFVCLWSETAGSDAPGDAPGDVLGDAPLAPSTLVQLLRVVPRVTVDSHGAIWADARGLAARDTAECLLQLLVSRGAGRGSVRAGIAAVPIAAEVAARYLRGSITQVREGEERGFLASLPIAVLRPPSALANLMDASGIECCGDLARVAREAAEVRFGADGARLWRLARADDPRPVFGSMPRTLPEASLEWADHTIRGAERLLFVVNALLGNVCEALRSRGEGAREMTLCFSLANRTSYEHVLRPARATASQAAWTRFVRTELERIALPDAVVGITLRVDVVSGVQSSQGDMFDRGFATARATEEAVARLLDGGGVSVVKPDSTDHPLADRRTSWIAQQALQVIRPGGGGGHRSRDHAAAAPVPRAALTLQLLPEPRRITVSTVEQRACELPRSYRDGGERYAIQSGAGPDRVSGGRWGEPYAREYFRCVNDAGTLVWIYRDARTGAWYLHGWWD